MAFYDRAARAIGALVAEHSGQTFAVVTHGGVISGYLSLLLKGRGSNRIAMRLRNGAISHLRWRHGAPLRVLAFNDTSHLRKQS